VKLGVVVLATVAAMRLAHADDVADLVAKGEALAKAAEYSHAIATFKAADAKQPRAKHACLIGLAYTRRELWPQAELFLALCRARATAADPLPDWIDEADATLATKLAAISAAPITIAVTPVSASITVSSFEPDEAFPPRTIHLSRGKHVLDISAPGYITEHRDVVVDTAAPRRIDVTLRLVAAEDARHEADASRHVARRNAWLVIGAGTALGLAGGAYHLFVMKPDRDAVANAPNMFADANDRPAFETARDVTLALYGAAVITVAVGAYMMHRTTSSQLALAPTRGGAMLVLEWR
jgi:hypothetical protein